MTGENNVSSLQQHLEGGSAAAIETALNLKATVGFPYSDYKYDVFDWDSESDYNRECHSHCCGRDERNTVCRCCLAACRDGQHIRWGR